MKAAIIQQFGPASVFQIIDIALPAPSTDKILVKINASSINPLDCKIRAGLVGDLCPQLPAILHGDFAGTVVAAPAECDLIVKDRVYGYCGGIVDNPGCLQQYRYVDAWQLAKFPSHWSYQQAAAVPLAGITASLCVQAVTAQHNQQLPILIHGGVGGVGHLTVQLAVAYGFQVHTTIVQAKDETLARSYGACEVIVADEPVQSYRQRLTANQGYTSIIDTIGAGHLQNSMAAAAKHGLIVTTQTRGQHDLSLMQQHGLTLKAILMLSPLLGVPLAKTYRAMLTEISRLGQLKQISPRLDSRYFSLDEISLAHALFESGQSSGKVIIDLNRD